MIKNIFKFLFVLFLLLFSGCSSWQEMKSFEVVNQGSRIDNIQLCYDTALKICKDKYGWNCKGVHMISEPICEDERCLC